MDQDMIELQLRAKDGTAYGTMTTRRDVDGGPPRQVALHMGNGRALNFWTRPDAEVDGTRVAELVPGTRAPEWGATADLR